MRLRIPLLAAALLAACAAPGGPPATAGPAEEGLDGAWQLVAGRVDGQELLLPEGARVTLVVDGSTAGGVAACNHYGGEIDTAGGGFAIGMMGMTEMACAEPLMALEAVYADAMTRVREATRDGETLTLSGDEVELRYELQPPPPTADLVDTTWILDGLVTGDAVAAPMGEPATLLLHADGTFEGSTGCRSFRGEWVEFGDVIDTPRWGMDGRVCPPELEAQDSHVVVVIGDSFRAVVEGSTLTLLDDDGQALTYRAEE